MYGRSGKKNRKGKADCAGYDQPVLSKKHGMKHGLCEECRGLLDYADLRAQKCPFKETKTFCSKCKVHCYKPDMRAQIRAVMKFSGPRMLLYHPISVVKHMVTG